MSAKSTSATPVRRCSKAAMAETRRGWLYAAPDWLFIVMLFIVPIVLLVIMAGSRWSLMGGNRGWNFPENFTKVFQHPLLLKSMGFTLEYTVIVTVILLALGLGLALLVQESSKWNSVLRTCFLLPSATGLASASLLFYALYSPQVGPVTKILSFFGLMEADGSVLTTGQGALWATALVIVWRYSGYYMLLMMIGLQSIPGDLYEAARMDGAGTWRIFRSITLPLMKPTIVMCLVYCVTGSILAFDQFFIITRGGPNNETLTVVQLIYSFAFESKKDLGMAAALSLIVLIFLVIINSIQMRGMRDDTK
ncbi:carbohydrate ABC transporter permease [Bifidobacterium longum]|uniref:carbohydrate ABC transporter permease n=1 Tax=Bifidobacterium longum TaxID=216816 RepID=UPI001C2172DA|nr:sugar ABC transporter permease [Bifidobacterium longum]MBU8985687.1 sugar ABC transporter permease [Bifidobacterium longum]MBU9086680.1 sugar ABC transporter permease [Bifidobacterium longum]